MKSLAERRRRAAARLGRPRYQEADALGAIACPWCHEAAVLRSAVDENGFDIYNCGCPKCLRGAGWVPTERAALLSWNNSPGGMGDDDSLKLDFTPHVPVHYLDPRDFRDVDDYGPERPWRNSGRCRHEGRRASSMG